MINLLFNLFFFVWPLGQLAVYQSSTFSHFGALDILNLTFFLYILIKNRKQILKDPLTKYITIFIAACVLSLLVNFSLGVFPLLLSSLYILRFITSISMYYLAKYHFKPRHRKSLFFSLLTFVFLGLLQYVFLPDMRFLKNLGFDDHYYRLVSTFLDPNFTGFILASLSIYLVSKKKMLSAITTLLALALTFSRASYLSFLVGILTLIVLNKRFKLLIFVALLVVFIVLIPKPFGEGVNLLRTYSIISRLTNQTTALNLWTNHLLFGVGFNTLKFSVSTTSNYPLRVSGVDNSFLYVLVTTGILGFSSFITLLYQIFKKLIYNTTLLSIYITLLFHSLFNNTFFYLWISVIFWTILGISSQRKINPK